jgi:Right handed beta helix region
MDCKVAIVVTLLVTGAFAACGTDEESSAGTTFYIDAAKGHDSDAGTSPASAWKTLERASEAVFEGGDRLLLRGGQRFKGTLTLDPSTVGSTSQADVLTIASYGNGRAKIEPEPRQDGITVSNVAGVRISDLNLVGRGYRIRHRNASKACRGEGFAESAQGKSPPGAAGIHFAASGIDGTLDQGITIDRVNVSGFCDGIVVASADNGSRIANVVVRAVSVHDNGDSGVWMYDEAEAHHSIEDVLVTDTRAYRNHRRGGIVLFGVDGGTVSHSLAWANASGAPWGVGIWAFDANRIVFKHNEAFRNGSPSIDQDGDGFDFDRGVSNSVMTHNYSHDNGGVGFLVCSCQRWGRYYAMRNITLRHNVSRNDGSSGQPSLFVIGGEPMRDINIVSNRVESGVGAGPVVWVSGNHSRYSDVRLVDNTFVARNGKQLLKVEFPELATNLVFGDNAWRAIGGPVSVDWGDHRFASLSEWRAALRAGT